jgi:hypothetical protein
VGLAEFAQSRLVQLFLFLTLTFFEFASNKHNVRFGSFNLAKGEYATDLQLRPRLLLQRLPLIYRLSLRSILHDPDYSIECVGHHYSALLA